MDDTLKLHLFNVLFRLRKITFQFPPRLDMHMGEMMFLRKMAEHAVNSAHSISHIHTKLHISKPAVSQMLRSLERKGYLVRSVDVSDRRKITVAITPKGCEFMHRMDDHMDAMLGEIIGQMGGADTRQLVTLLNRLIDIMQSQHCEPPHSCETPLSWGTP